LNESRVRIKESVEASGLRHVDVASTIVTYDGYAAPGALTSERKWQIRRASVQGTQTVYEYANSGEFDQIWDNRSSLFDSIPFFNSYSCLLDGVNDYVDLGDSFNYERTDDWSWSFWYRPTSQSANHCLYARRTSGGVGISIQVQANGRVFVELRNTNSTNHLSVQGPTGNILLNTWYNIVVTYDGSSTPGGIKVYINGTSITLSTVTNTLTSSIVSNGTTATLGAMGGTTYLTGYLEEVSHWSRVLTSTEVTELFNSGSPTNLATHSAYADMLSWWRMGDGDTYPSLTDNKGSIAGTITNATSGSIVNFHP
jgi:hypothetical protein